jgi:hypothetical protein
MDQGARIHTVREPPPKPTERLDLTVGSRVQECPWKRPYVSCRRHPARVSPAARACRDMFALFRLRRAGPQDPSGW